MASRDLSPAASGESRASIIEACAKACEDTAETFLSDAYATGQPLSSFNERYACRACAKAIRALNLEHQLQSEVTP